MKKSAEAFIKPNKDVIFFGRMVNEFHIIESISNVHISFYDNGDDSGILRGIEIDGRKFGQCKGVAQDETDTGDEGIITLRSVISGLISSHTAIKYLNFANGDQIIEVGEYGDNPSEFCFINGLDVKLLGISYNPKGSHICGLAFEIVRGEFVSRGGQNVR